MTNCAIGLVALSGVWILLFATGHGIGLNTDSINYIGAVRELLQGNGLRYAYDNRQPITHYPPFYPILLSAVSVFGIDPWDGARLLNAVLFGINIFQIGLFLHKSCGKSFGTALAGSLLMLFSVSMLDLHSLAISEPLFILLGFLGLFLLAEYIREPRVGFLVSSSVAIGLALLTRYAGVPFLITGVLGIVLFGGEKLRSGRKTAVTFLILACLPTGLWALRNLYVAGTATNRILVFHPISWNRIQQGISTFSAWLPFNSSGLGPLALLGIACGAILLISLILLRGSKQMARHGYFPVLLLMFFLGYCLFLFVSISFLDARTPLDNRILSPLHVSGLFLTLFATYVVLNLSSGQALSRAFFVVVCTALCVSYPMRAIQWVRTQHLDGRSYASRVWRDSEIMNWARELPPGSLIYSNGADALYIHTGKKASWIPRKVIMYTLLANETYLSEVAGMTNRMEHQGAAVVYFKKISWRDDMPTPEELKKQIPLKVLFESSDGIAYQWKHRDSE